MVKALLLLVVVCIFVPGLLLRMMYPPQPSPGAATVWLERPEMQRLYEWSPLLCAVCFAALGLVWLVAQLRRER